MTLKEAIRKHPSSFIVLMPLKRDTKTNKPLTFRVLVACYSASEAIAAERQYISDGFEDVCILPNYEEEMKFPPEEAARMFRVLYGMGENERGSDISEEPVKVFKVLYKIGGDGSGDHCARP